MNTPSPRSGDDAPLLSFLVVTWKTPLAVEHSVRQLRRAMDELEEADGLGGPLTAEVIVVDNASEDGTTAVLSQHAEDPRVDVITNANNLGFSGGNNQAFRAARGSMIAVVNPDVLVEADAVRAAVAHLRSHPEAGAATCRLIGPDGRPQHLHRSFPTVRSVLATQTTNGRRFDNRLLGGRVGARYRLEGLPDSGVVPIEQAAGAFVITPRWAVAVAGGYLFDETLPLFFSDVDLCRRLDAAGLEVHLLLDHALAHEGSVSLSQLDSRDRSIERWRSLVGYFEAAGRPAAARAVRMTAPPAARARTGRRLAPGLSTDKPLVSIVIPAYNYGRHLGQAIDSALGQSYEAVEVLVVDDGSTDDTAAVAAGYPQVRYHFKPNGGLSSARNVGAQLARGELIAFLDADNRLASDFVEETLAGLRDDPWAAFAYPQLRYFGDEADETDERGDGGESHRPDFDAGLLAAGNYIDACALIHTDLVRRFPYDERNRIGWEDWDFWLTLAEHGYRGRLVDKPLVHYRRHADAMTAQISWARRRDLRARILRRHREFVGNRTWAEAEWRRWRVRAGLARRRLTSAIPR